MSEWVDVLARIEALETELAQLKAIAVSLSASVPAHRGSNWEVPQGVAPSRRSLLRGGAVALGAVAAALTSGSVDAADGSPLIIGAANTSTDNTRLSISTSVTALVVESEFNVTGGLGIAASAPGPGGTAMQASAASLGLSAFAASEQQSRGVLAVGRARGVEAITAFPEGAGVIGMNNASTVDTNSPAVGVWGLTRQGGYGVRGEITQQSLSSAVAVYGLNRSDYVGGNPGGGGFGVYGYSKQGHGLVGATAAAGAAAVVGATNGVSSAYAGVFYGPVAVGGSFTVFGGPKSAAVRHPDGNHRRLYCMESPESWFEDFGSGQLVCGEARITLDPDLVAVVDTAEYHVFITGYDGHHDLSVSDRTSNSFTVKAASGETAGTFSWRVVARRKDFVGSRFERVLEIPREPVPPSITPPPEPFDLSSISSPERPTT